MKLPVAMARVIAVMEDVIYNRVSPKIVNHPPRVTVDYLECEEI